MQDRLIAESVEFIDAHQHRGVAARIAALADECEHSAALTGVAAPIRIQCSANLAMGLRSSFGHQEPASAVAGPEL